MLKGQIEIALLYANPELEQDGAQEEADRICAGFFEQLPDVQQRLLKDVQAGFDGDPAAKSKEEIISSYPVCLQSMYIVWRIFYIKKKFRIFRGS